MNIGQYINGLEFAMKSSPLRQMNNIKIKLPTTELERIINNLNEYRTISDNPLKVVCMGEVKAGKSTFINAVIGREISRVDVLEATAIVIEIGYGKEEKGKIYTKDNKNMSGSLEEILDVLSVMKDNKEFNNNVERVELKVAASKLRDIRIVDTPGVATLTESNENTTNEYIKNADVILWILNGNYLGQTDINERIKEIRKMGKDVIAIINRIDEVDEEPAKLVKYLKREMRLYLKAIFPLSAKIAYEGRRDQDLAKQEESGYLDIMDYLQENIVVNVEEVKIESVENSIKGLIKKELLYHKDQLNILEEKINKSLIFKSQVEKCANEVEREIDIVIKRWQNRFLREEEDMIINALDAENMMQNFFGDNEKLMSLATQHLSDENIEQKVYDLYEEVRVKYKESWNEKINELKIELDVLNREFKEFVNYTENNYLLAVSNQPISEKNEIQTVAKQAGIYGASLIGYGVMTAAVLPLTAGIGAVLPPVLIAGAAAGLAFKYLDYNNKKNDVKSQIKNRIDQVRADLGVQSANNMKAEVRKDNSDKIKNIMDSVASGLTIEEYNELISAIKRYLVTIESLEVEAVYGQ